MEVQVTSWSNLNPRFWAPRGFGVTDLVLPNTSMKGVYLRRCGEPIFQQGLANPLEIDIDISQPEGVYPGYLVEFMCAVFDEGLGAWSTAGMSSKHVITTVSTEMTCLATRSSGLFAALYRVVREEPPNTTTPLPPPPEVDEGLTLGALLAIVGGGTVLLCGCTGGLYAWHKMRSREPVEPEPEEEEEEVVETESESEIAELPDPDPALTKLRLAAEAGTLTAREILANHSGPMGIRQELVWALDKGYEKKRQMAAMEVEWKECFDLYDKDSDGKIKATELGDVLRSLGLVLTQKEVQELKDEVGSDLVSWEKFKDLAAKKPRQPEKQAHALLQAFQAFDQSGSGQVDMKELRHIVTNLGEKLTTKEFEEICKAADLPAAGALDYKKASKKRRDASTESPPSEVVDKVFQKDTVKEELADLAKSDSGDDASGASFTPIHAKAPAKKMRRQQSPGQSDPRSSRTSRGSGSRRNSGSRRRSEQSGKSRQSGQSGQSCTRKHNDHMKCRAFHVLDEDEAFSYPELHCRCLGLGLRNGAWMLLDTPGGVVCSRAAGILEFTEEVFTKCVHNVSVNGCFIVSYFTGNVPQIQHQMTSAVRRELAYPLSLPSTEALGGIRARFEAAVLQFEVAGRPGSKFEGSIAVEVNTTGSSGRGPGYQLPALRHRTLAVLCTSSLCVPSRTTSAVSGRVQRYVQVRMIIDVQTAVVFVQGSPLLLGYLESRSRPASQSPRFLHPHFPIQLPHSDEWYHTLMSRLRRLGEVAAPGGEDWTGKAQSSFVDKGIR
ncbi:unnamed protein product [Symbiodinium sp. CCMP2592]|nr:unnamed protein product [Symbiodinium sp. CCMP2592]